MRRRASMAKRIPDTALLPSWESVPVLASTSGAGMGLVHPGAGAVNRGPTGNGADGQCRFRQSDGAIRAPTRKLTPQHRYPDPSAQISEAGESSSSKGGGALRH